LAKIATNAVYMNCITNLAFKIKVSYSEAANLRSNNIFGS